MKDIINFRPLSPDNFPLLLKWQSQTHVSSTWGNELYEEPYEIFIYRTNDGSVYQFVIEYQGQPIGYFQYYWANKAGKDWWAGIDPNTVGIDFYIGNPDQLGKGLSKEIILAARKMLFNNQLIHRIIADPSPKNHKIASSLTSAGFKNLGEVTTPDGPAILFELSRE